MRRIILLSVLLIMLGACGAVATRSSVPTSTRQPAQTNAYPAPSSAPALPTQIPPTMASVPTVVPSPTAAVKPLTITKIQSLNVSHQPLWVRDLLGWSPDDRYFLYDRVDRFDQASRLLLGEVYALDISTGDDIRIPEKDVILGIHSDGYTYSLGTARWSEQCCTILTSSLNQGKQSIDSFDLKTKNMRHLKTTDVSFFGYQGKKIGLVEQGIFTLDNIPVSYQFLDATTWLTSTVLTQHGLYTHNGRDLRYISDKNEIWDMHGDITFLKDKPQYKIMWVAPSSDGTMIAVVIAEGHSRSRELWVINRNTDEFALIASDFLAYPSWSGDGTLLMYRISSDLVILDLTTNTQTLAVENANIPVWHHTKPWFAMLNQNTTTIDIYAVYR